MKKRAVIVGSSGQDGTLLYEYLINDNYAVLGVDRDVLTSNGIGWNQPISISKEGEVVELIKTIRPDEIYYLAAVNQSSEDRKTNDLELYQKSYSVNVLSLINFLEAVRLYSPSSKIFYASSSMVFGQSKTEKQNEETAFNPDTIYGITKLDGLLACRYYRNIHNIFASVGILYNHESALRTKNFISRKVIQGAIDIKNQKKKELVVGDLNASADWGYAPDFVRAMHSLLKMEKSGEYIVSTGQKHSVRDMVARVFSDLELDWKEFVREDKGILTREKVALIGDHTKLSKMTGWKPSISFDDMISSIAKQLLDDALPKD